MHNGQPPRDGQLHEPRSRLLIALAVAVFFVFGGVTSLNDVLIPKLKGLFSLSFTEAMLVQFAFFTSYAVFSIPAGLILTRLGYTRGIVLGFVVMALACLLFLPASHSSVLAPFLATLFVLGAGITLLQVAVNPLIVALGPPETSHSRLVFAQFFNSLGVFITTRFATDIILGSKSNTPGVLAGVYGGIAAVLVLAAFAFWLCRRDLDGQAVTTSDVSGGMALLRQPRLARGVVALFAYVGAEVSIASLMVGYLGDARTLALSPHAAGVLLSYYWFGALAGRLWGGFLIRRIAAWKLLGLFAVGAMILLLISATSHGGLAGWSLVLVGCANSIMFPTIFSLSVQGLGPAAAKASGLLCTAIIGGAILPLLTGVLADRAGLAAALAAPAACYAWIRYFSWSVRPNEEYPSPSLKPFHAHTAGWEPPNS